MFSSFKTPTSNLQGLDCGLFAGWFFVRKDSVYCCFLCGQWRCVCGKTWGILSQTFLFILSLKRTAIKKRGRRTEVTVHFEGLNRSGVRRLTEYLLVGTAGNNNHKELLSSPVRSKTTKPIRVGLCAHLILTDVKVKVDKGVVVLLWMNRKQKGSVFYFCFSFEVCDLTGISLLIF